MKKLTGLLLLVVVLTQTSCVREYICQCKVEYSGNVPGLPPSTISETVIKGKEKDAREFCKKNSLTIVQDKVTMKETCDLY